MCVYVYAVRCNCVEKAGFDPGSLSVTSLKDVNFSASPYDLSGMMSERSWKLKMKRLALVQVCLGRVLHAKMFEKHLIKLTSAGKHHLQIEWGIEEHDLLLCHPLICPFRWGMFICIMYIMKSK